ncbi:hypothetical protein [Kitasatospora viridis]|uniref:hypothetical protein n=1 Tax=Kitasatospora viridis TaxID=281105 RepID=UPI0011A6461F|nr:hypothetical protein [Kitasatospora viridis]
MALTLGPALWVRPGSGSAVRASSWPSWAGCCDAGCHDLFGPGAAARARGRPNLLTARTGTGERTVDLGQIARISSFEFLSRGTYDSPALIVKDRRGVRLGV